MTNSIDAGQVGDPKPIIPFADEAILDADTRTLLAKSAEMLGVVPNAGRTYAHRPDIAKLIQTMYETIVLSECSNLDPALKNKLGVICSSINACVYCTSHQCNVAQGGASGGVERRGLTDDELLALISGHDEGKNDTERLCFEFARVASRSPGDVSVQLLERLKQHLSAAQIVELGCVVSMWKFFNTMHDSLHIPSEGVMSRYATLLDRGHAAGHSASAPA